MPYAFNYAHSRYMNVAGNDGGANVSALSECKQSVDKPDTLPFMSSRIPMIP
jgi:hypothetical protein